MALRPLSYNWLDADQRDGADEKTFLRTSLQAYQCLVAGEVITCAAFKLNVRRRQALPLVATAVTIVLWAAGALNQASAQMEEVKHSHDMYVESINGQQHFTAAGKVFSEFTSEVTVVWTCIAQHLRCSQTHCLLW